MRGWLFDLYPDYEQNAMVLWLKRGRERVRLTDPGFEPCLYVHHPSAEELRALARSMNVLDQVERTELQMRKIDLRSRRPEQVLAVYPSRYSALRECARIIDSRGGYLDYQLFNVDLRFAQQYLIERELYPLALVETSPTLEAFGGQFRVNYRLPRLTSVSLSVNCEEKVLNMRAPIASITIDDMVLEGGEEDILPELAGTVKRLDPDIIFTDDGDATAFPYLEHRLAVNGLGEEFTLGRDKGPLAPSRRGRSYFQYGGIRYRPPAYELRGRLHIDRSSFIYGEGGMYGLADMARLSNLPLQTIARLTPGSAISAMQVQQALRDGYLILWKKNRPEDFKSADQLLLADRGGIIFDPVPGVHENVVEVDFVSLYPNIMARYNISPETLLCDCCPDSRTRVPELLYHICEKRTGLIPKVVGPLVQRRLAYKEMMTRRPEMSESYERRAGLLKWVLVTCFGYTGYRNARFGRIECHEAINAYAREILLTTKELAETLGYEILHGIVDSLWLKPNGRKDHEWFCAHVSKRMGIPLELEGVYKWLVFLPNKGTGTGALNRYYGAFEDGRLKVRGIDLRKHDTPELIRKAQKDMLDILAKANDASELTQAAAEALKVLERYRELLRSHSCDPHDLIITKRISKTLGEYTVFNDQAAALSRAKALGMKVRPGQKLGFVVTDADSRDPARRLRLAVELEGSEPYDAGRYVELLERATLDMLGPMLDPPRSRPL